MGAGAALAGEYGFFALESALYGLRGPAGRGLSPEGLMDRGGRFSSVITMIA
jgi:hypothetical protein